MNLFHHPKLAVSHAGAVHHHPPILPMLNLLLAGGAAVLAVIAITDDDVANVNPTTSPAVVTTVERDGGACRLGAIRVCPVP
jgi:hypothetical protein